MPDLPEKVRLNWLDRARQRSDEFQRYEEERTRERREGRLLGKLTAGLKDKLRNCNPQQLRNVMALCRTFLRDHRTAPVSRECKQRFPSTILVGVPVGNKRYQLERRACGKNCGNCPNHGPYLYAYYRDGSIIKQRSFGKPPFKERLPPKVRSAIRKVIAADLSQ